MELKIIGKKFVFYSFTYACSPCWTARCKTNLLFFWSDPDSAWPYSIHDWNNHKFYRNDVV